MRLYTVTALALILGLTTGLAGADTTAATATTDSAAAAAKTTGTATAGALKIHFASGKVTIAQDQAAALDEAARSFRDGSPIVMIVAGSADTVGSADLNLDLSIRRAQAVARALADRGIPINRLQVLGRGNSELEVATADGVANAENRTVSITWR